MLGSALLVLIIDSSAECIETQGIDNDTNEVHCLAAHPLPGALSQPALL